MLEEKTNQAHTRIELDQYGRRSTLEIAGIPRADEENTEEICIKLFNSLGVNVHAKDIEACHRISQRENANISVRFNNRKPRDKVLMNRRQLRGKSTHDFGINTERSPAKIFLNESLTRQNKELFRQAQEFKRGHAFKFIWTRNGNIFIRKTEHSKVIKITHQNDLKESYAE